jgi:hypothetical protein
MIKMPSNIVWFCHKYVTVTKNRIVHKFVTRPNFDWLIQQLKYYRKIISEVNTGFLRVNYMGLKCNLIRVKNSFESHSITGVQDFN